MQPHVRPHAGRHAAGPRPARSMPYRPLGEVRAPILREQAHRPSSCRPWRMEPLYRQGRQWPFAANPPFPAARRHARAMPVYGRNRADPDIYGELNHCRQTPCRASSANDGPHPCHARTRRAIHHHCPQSRSTAAIVPCVPPLQPGTNRLSHNSGSRSLGVGAIPTAILGFEGLISWFGDIHFRFKGLVIGQNPSTNGFTPMSFRRFGAVATRPSAPRNGSGCLGTSKSAP